MKTKFKVIIAVILAVVIGIGSISAYKYITSPKEESIPLETTLEDAAELTTQREPSRCSTRTGSWYSIKQPSLPGWMCRTQRSKRPMTRLRSQSRTARSMKIQSRSSPVT